MQFYFRKFHKILGQQNNFEWNPEHQKQFNGIKTFFTEQIIHFWIWRSVFTTTLRHLSIELNISKFTQTELRFSILTRNVQLWNSFLTEHKFLVFGSKHPIVFFTDQNTLYFSLNKKINLTIEQIYSNSF